MPDKGYVNQKREERLANEGYECISSEGVKDEPLSEAQQRRNRRIASPRARVEHVFAGMAQLAARCGVRSAWYMSRCFYTGRLPRTTCVVSSI
ncbi:hypothetical protein GJV26_14065 [Massilia dura]|uniref:Uncharacterized protein n=2 Tax=Pseudoduganella dura TaxID=321982 RepID=A0A6I3XGC3_9BURK|nr:hypothetical protein [Pseudoduganella dura]MUI13580.1 hypothetical protein [Pseudoduganella dura]